jgi:hypothetical protein
MGNKNVHRVLVETPEVKQPCGRPKHRCEDINMDVGDIRWEGLELSDFTGTSSRSLPTR